MNIFLRLMPHIFMKTRQKKLYTKMFIFPLQKCSTEVFVEGLLRPSIESGDLGKMTDQMLMIDPSLEKWNHYMTAVCRYLVRNRLHHVLYEFQLFMKVGESLHFVVDYRCESQVAKFILNCSGYLSLNCVYFGSKRVKLCKYQLKR